MIEKMINRSISPDEKFAVYGAGVYAGYVYNLFFFNNCVDRLRYFIVSNKKNNPDQIYNIPVIAIEKAADLCGDCSVIIAISAAKSMDIKKNIRPYGFKEIITLNPSFIEMAENDIYEHCCKMPLQRKQVFFDCYNGGGFSCNCKYIAKTLKDRGWDGKILWDVNDKCYDGSLPEYIRGVEYGSPEYYIGYYTSGFVVFNGASPGNSRKREGQYYIATWHGTGPTKKIGVELSSNGPGTPFYLEQIKNGRNMDLAIAASRQCIRNFREGLLYQGEIQKWGYPRNDILFASQENLKQRIHKEYRIDADDKIALYAPTFRYELLTHQNERNLNEIYDLDLCELKKTLEKRFNTKVTLLYRFHLNVYRYVSYDEYYSNGAVDVTLYPDMQELLAVTDFLITDYSSSMWDFSLTRKPVFLYYNDKEECEKRTGFYRDPDTYPYPKGHTTEELCKVIEDFDNTIYQKSLEKWFSEYETYDDGHAAEKVVNRMIDVAEHPEKYGKDMEGK